MQTEYSSYEKGLLLKFASKNIADLIKRMGLKHKGTLPMGKDSLWITEKKTSIEPPRYLADRLSKNKDGQYTYRIYLLSIIAAKDEYIFISCPHPRLLEEVLGLLKPKENSKNEKSPFSFSYVACDLMRFCNEKFYGENDDCLYIRRMNAQVLGEENNKTVSVGLYGRDVLQSNTLKKILEIKGTNNERSEKSNSIFSKILIPNSIRLTYDDGTELKDEEFSLNTDKFGNYSFFLRKTIDFERILYTFKLLYAQNCLHSGVDTPLKRSDAIKLVEGEGKGK